MSKLSHLRNRDGAALVSVMLVLVFLSMLLVSLLGVSLAESKHAIRSEQSVKALYHAKSVGTAAAENLISNEEDAKSIFLKTDETTIIYNDAYENGQATVVATRNTVDTITLLSTWSNSTSTGRVRIRLQKGVPPTIAGNFGIQSKSIIEAQGSYNMKANIIAFDVEYVEVDDDPIVFTKVDADDLYAIKQDYLNTFPSINPWPLNVADTYEIPGGITTYKKIINDTDHVKYVDVLGPVTLSGVNDVLIFETDYDLYVRINGDFSVTGSGNSPNIKLIGTGTVHIYVEGDLYLGGNCVNETGDSVSPERFRFYIPEPDPLSDSEKRIVILSGTSAINATIFAPYADMTTSGSPTFSGISYVDSYSGNGSFLYNQNPIPSSVFEDPLLGWALQITAYGD